MNGERLTSADKRLIVVVILIAIASVIYVRFNYFAAFPEASIDLRYSKDQITRMAQDFLGQRDLATEGYRNLTLFDPDESARIYLEREVGLEEANRLMQSKVSVWRWRARWFRPPEKEEMIVFLSPTGGLAGFQHVIPEAQAGERLERDAAMRIAAAFLQEQTQSRQRLVEEQLQERPNRHDYVFTWEEEGFRVKDATCRRTIVVQGGQVGSYSEYLHVPEQWKRDFAKLRSRNELYSQIAQAFYLPLVLAAIVFIIRSFRRGLIRWKPILLITIVVGGLMVVNEWNALPFFIDSMPTSSSYSQTLVFGLLMGLGAGVGVFFYVILAAAAGEPLYRRSQPSKLSLLAVPSRRGIRTKEFFLATVVGYGFAAAHIAFVVAFYLIGRRFGVWSPQDVNYSDFLSTRLPWIYPLTISLLASTSEEFWFRLFAIPFLKRYLRSTWLVVVIPAFVWGFLHATYPQQPGFIRGIEVGLIGVVAGFLMLRFGILATLIWHYAVDAVMIGMFLIRAESWYFQVSGWLVGGAVLFPLLVSLAFYWKHGGFLADPELMNAGADIEPARREPAPAVLPGAEPVAPRWPVKWLYVAAIVAGLGGLAVRSTQFGDFIRVHLSRDQAETLAGQELEARVPDPDEWLRVTDFVPNLGTAEFEYIRRLAGRHKANEVVREHTATGIWRTRFFRSLQKEEWRVYVDQEGRAFRTDHLLDEKAPGASLSFEEASHLAQNYLSEKHGLSADRYRLVDSSTDKKDNRTDYTYVWEDRSFELGEAKARVSLDIVGDEPSAFRRFLKLPEEWLREFQKPRLAGILVPGVIGAVAILLLVAFVKRLSERSPEAGSGHRYHWKAYLLVAGGAVIVALIASVNRWPEVLAGYDTAKPLQSHIIQFLLGRLMLAALLGLGLFLAALVADVFLQMVAGDRRPRPASLLRAAAVFLLLWGVSRVVGVAWEFVPGRRLSLPLWSLPGAETLLPGVAVLASALVSAISLVCVFTIAVAASLKYLHRRGLLILVGVAGLLYAVSRAQSPQQFAFLFCVTLLWAGLLAALVGLCATDLVTFGIALFWLQTAGAAATLIEQPAAWFRWNGVGCVALALALGIVAARRCRRASQAAPW